MILNDLSSKLEFIGIRNIYFFVDAIANLSTDEHSEEADKIKSYFSSSICFFVKIGDRRKLIIKNINHKPIGEKITEVAKFF